MPDPFISADTLDDLLRSVAAAIQEHGHYIEPTKGPAREVIGYQLELRDPRARLSRTETRGKAFSCLGELCWYLSGSADAAFIEHYIPGYPGADSDGKVFAAYGPRFFNMRGHDQVQNVISRLRRAKASRKAVIQVFDAGDLPSGEDEIPCTCTLQFLIREGRVHLLVTMRSNDVVLGLPHDVFCFTMLQEIVARSVGVEMGTYRHHVGSLHIYQQHEGKVRAFLSEGWQATTRRMPEMPLGDPWEALDQLLSAEARIREGSDLLKHELDSANPYWADLMRLLLVHAAVKDADVVRVLDLRDRFSSDVYHTFVDGRLAILGNGGKA